MKEKRIGKRKLTQTQSEKNKTETGYKKKNKMEEAALTKKSQKSNPREGGKSNPIYRVGLKGL